MKLKVLALCALMMASAASLQAEARRSSSGVLFTANAFMYNTEAEQGSASAKSENSVIDLKLGYLGGSGLYLGGMYSTRDMNGADGNAIAASVGYVGSKGFFIKGHYVASAELDEWKEGTGFQVDFGYLSNVTSSFVVGVEITHRSIEYAKHDTVPGKYKLTETMPMLTLGFVF